MNGFSDKTVDRFFVKMDSLQASHSKTNEQLAVVCERQATFAKDQISLSESMERNHHRIRMSLEKQDREFKEALKSISDRINKIESYSKNPSIIGQFITRNKVALMGLVVVVIGAVVEAGRMLYKMPPPH